MKKIICAVLCVVGLAGVAQVSLLQVPGGVSQQPAASGFTPADLTGLRGWYKPEGLTNTVDASAVIYWPDSSGNGFHLTNGAAATQPSIKTSELNGHSIVRFDGGDYLRHDVNSADTKPNWFFVYAKGTNTTSGLYIFDSYDATSRIYLRLMTGPVVSYPGLSGSTTVTSGTWHSHAFKNTAVSNTSTNWVNGTIDSNGTTSDNYDGVMLGSRWNFAEGFQGDIAEFFWVNGSLTETERQNVETYFSNKY